MDLSLISILIFTGIAALLFSYSGHRHITNLILIVGLVGILADWGAGILQHLPHRIATQTPGAASTTSPMQVPIPPRSGYAEELPEFEGEAMQLGVCPQEKNKPTLIVNQAREEVRIEGEASCWSREICGQGTNYQMEIRSRGHFAGCTWYRNGLGRFRYPFCFGVGQRPDIGEGVPNCLRVLGAGEIDVEFLSREYPNDIR